MENQIQTRYTLLQRACDLQDERAWEEFVDHYRRFIFYILNKMGVAAADIEDVTQHILLSLTKDLEKYDVSRGRFRHWLSRVIRNAALVYFRSQRNRQKRVHIFGEEQRENATMQLTEIDQRIEQEWASYVVTLALDRVKLVFHGQAITVFELALNGVPAGQIADQTGLTLSSVYTLKKRVKKRLYLEIRALAAELEPS